MDIGSKIKTLRKDCKLTQEELSKKANISRSYLADIERNRYNPSVDTLVGIANALNLTLSELVDDNNNAKPSIQPKNYFIEQYLETLGYEIIYDSEGNIILDSKSAQYEISESDIINLQQSTDSFIKFKLFEIMSNSKIICKDDNIPMAAHNDFAKDPEQQKLMKEDLDDL